MPVNSSSGSPPPELLAQRAQAEASLQGAEAQLSSAKAKLSSDQGTYQHLTAAAETPGVIAGNDLQVAEPTAAADKAQVEASSKNVQAAQSALRSVAQLELYLEIRAPFDGVVTQRNLYPGALVGPLRDRRGHNQSFRLRISAGCVWLFPCPKLM